MTDQEQHQKCTNKFIAVANELAKEGIDRSMVSGAMMTASCVYATYISAGNKGALEPSGVDKVVALFRRTMEQHQKSKKAHLLKNKA